MMYSFSGVLCPWSVTKLIPARCCVSLMLVTMLKSCQVLCPFDVSYSSETLQGVMSLWCQLLNWTPSRCFVSLSVTRLNSCQVGELQDSLGRRVRRVAEAHYRGLPRYNIFPKVLHGALLASITVLELSVIWDSNLFQYKIFVISEISHSSTWHNHQHSTFNQLKTHSV